MAQRYFADTFYMIALLSPRDARHHEANRMARSLTGEVVTTEAVLIELADALCSPRDRLRTAAFIEKLRAGENTLIRPLEGELLKRSLDFYKSRQDKEWGLTDCISFVVMQEEGITEALTGDEHFRQAGFRILFPQS